MPSGVSVLSFMAGIAAGTLLVGLVVIFLLCLWGYIVGAGKRA